MTESANLRSIRIQYLYVDQNDAALRDIRVDYLAVDKAPVSVRRVNAQMLTVSEDPANLRNQRLQYLESTRDPVSLRRVLAQALVVDKGPANVRDTRLQYIESTRDPVSLRRVLAQAMVIEKAPANVRDARLQYLERTRDPVSVRRILSQVLMVQKDPLYLKGMRAQYLTLENTPPNFTIDAWPRLLEIINNNNGTKFKLGDVLPGLPTRSLKLGTWNTQLEITAQPSSGYSGKVTVYYERYPIGLSFQDIHPVFDFTGVTTSHDLLPQINAFFGLKLTPAEIVATPMIPQGPNITSFDLVASENAWFYVPGSKFHFSGLPDLKTVYAVTDLSGFDLPM